MKENTISYVFSVLISLSIGGLDSRGSTETSRFAKKATGIEVFKVAHELALEPV